MNAAHTSAELCWPARHEAVLWERKGVPQPVALFTCDLSCFACVFLVVVYSHVAVRLEFY